MLFFLTHLATTEPYTLSLHDALPILAAVASLQDNPERAVRLFAAASSMLESSGSGWLHAYIPRVPCDDAALAALRSRAGDRSEEHTSELQSHSDLVCRLLLEKKKKRI